MKRACSALAAALALAACSPAPATGPTPAAATSAASARPTASLETTPDPTLDVQVSNIQALAHTYQFTPAGEAEPACMIKLDAEEHQGDDAEPIRSAWIAPDCYTKFPALRGLASWKAPAAGAVQLIDMDGKIIGDFSPVQDGSGVYIRGGAGGKLYEMRTPGE